MTSPTVLAVAWTDPSTIGYSALFGGVLLVSFVSAWVRRRRAARTGQLAGPGPEAAS